MVDLETQESEVVESAQVEQPEPTDRESIAEKLAEIRARNAAPETADDESAKPAKPEKVRAPDGKFAKSEQTKEPPAEAPAQADQTQAQPTAAPVAATAIQPPTSYTAEGKAEFLKASPAIQREIVKRENDFHKYYHAEVAPLKQAAQYGQEIYKAIQPYEQTIKQWGASPAQAVQALFEADRKLTTGSPQEKIQAFATLAKGYGIDLSQGLPEQPAYDPNVEFLQRQIQQANQAAQIANQRIQQSEARYQQERQAAEQSQLNSAIEQAKQGKPHFDELRMEIGTILQSAINRGQEITIDQAYEAACWQSPKHRAELLAKQQAEVAATAAQKRAEEASKAKGARLASSVNVAKRGTLQAQRPVGDTKTFISEQLEKIRNR